MNDKLTGLSVEQVYAAQQNIISSMKENQLDLAEKKLRELATILNSAFRIEPSDYLKTSITWVGATERDLAEQKENQRLKHIKRTNEAIEAHHKAENIKKHLHPPKPFRFPIFAVVLLGMTLSVGLVQLYCAYSGNCIMTVPSWLDTVMKNPIVSALIQKAVDFLRTHPEIFYHTVNCGALNTHAVLYTVMGLSLGLAVLVIVFECVLYAVRHVLFQIVKYHYNHWLKKAVHL